MLVSMLIESYDCLGGLQPPYPRHLITDVRNKFKLVLGWFEVHCSVIREFGCKIDGHLNWFNSVSMLWIRKLIP